MEPSVKQGPSAPAKNVYSKIPALLKVTKLTVSDLAFLVNVSRPTVYHWVEQTTIPRGIKKQRLDRILKSIHNAFVSGRLPFPVKPLNARIRKQALIEVLKDDA